MGVSYLHSKQLITPVSKHILDNLFGSRIRIKVLKFLFRNYPGSFSVNDISHRIQESYGDTKKELEDLMKIKLIKKR